MPKYIENDTIKYHAVTRTSENCYQAFYYPISNKLYSVPRVQKITKGKGIFFLRFFGNQIEANKKE